MAAFDMNGTWAGEYSYDPIAGALLALPPVRFTLMAEIGWFGHLGGTVHDERERGIPVPATIDGKVAGTRVTFQKQYPVYFVSNGERSILLSESLETQGIEMDEEIPPRRSATGVSTTPIRWRLPAPGRSSRAASPSAAAAKRCP